MTELQPNNDFLSSSDDTEKVAVRKRRTALEIEQDEYPEYHALNDYEKKCLAPNNYWRVMSGMEIIKVPPSDKKYHKYFDNRCYDLCYNFQKQKKSEAIERDIIEAERKVKEDIINASIQEKLAEASELKVTLIEKEVEVIKTIEPIKVVEPVKVAEAVKVIEPPKIEKPKKVQEKKQISSNEEQISLF